MTTSPQEYHNHRQPPGLHSLLWLSITAALLTMGLKLAAWAFTGSVSLLSDALESIVNLVAAGIALIAVRYAGRPADSTHPYGHEKIEYFSSGLEGGLILVAGLSIVAVAIERLIHPQDRLELGIGLILTTVATAVNLCVARLLIQAGKANSSIAIEADGKHLLTDVWTSVGVLVGLGLVWITNWTILDPVMALLVAAVILWTGFDLMRRSFDGLMDRALPDPEITTLSQTLESFMGPEMMFHALRTRQAGARRFADFHLLVPGQTSVQEAHDLVNRIETALARVLPELSVTIHIEPIEDSTSHSDLPVPPSG